MKIIPVGIRNSDTGPSNQAAFGLFLGIAMSIFSNTFENIISRYQTPTCIVSEGLYTPLN